MPILREVDEIRRRLQQDPAWSAYALGDLDEHRFPHSRWYGLPGEPSLALMYCEFPQPVFFFHGPPQALEQLLAEIPWEGPTHLQVQADALAVLAAHAPVTWSKPMIRMLLEKPSLDTGSAIALGVGDAAELEGLYADGAAGGESPDFFFPSMLDGGFFFGVRREGQLVAAAGTHIVSLQESTAAIGNVYTHRGHRSQGLAQAVTSAVTQALMDAEIRTIVLNVAEQNAAAIRVYEKLGFVEHCRFFEALAG